MPLLGLVIQDEHIVAVIITLETEQNLKLGGSECSHESYMRSFVQSKF